MNSFSAVERALRFEEIRQRGDLDRGRIIPQETRGWIEDRGVTVSQRTKEQAHDYRYFPEPDLPPLRHRRVAGQRVAGDAAGIAGGADETVRRAVSGCARRMPRCSPLNGRSPTTFEIVVSAPGCRRGAERGELDRQRHLGAPAPDVLPPERLPFTPAQISDLLDASWAKKVSPLAPPRNCFRRSQPGEMPTACGDPAQLDLAGRRRCRSDGGGRDAGGLPGSRRRLQGRQEDRHRPTDRRDDQANRRPRPPGRGPGTPDRGCWTVNDRPIDQEYCEPSLGSARVDRNRLVRRRYRYHGGQRRHLDATARPGTFTERLGTGRSLPRGGRPVCCRG